MIKVRFKAFTLVELMVVMAIIAFLSVGAYAGITFALRQGRNTQRMRVADQLQTALTAYYADFQKYPTCTGASRMSTSNSSLYVYPCPGLLTISGGTGQEAQPGAVITQDAPVGLKEYFDGDFKLGAIKEVDSVMYYFHKPSASSTTATKFTVCVDLEGPRGGNTTKVSPHAKAGQNDCYCVGSEQAAIACNGVVEIE